MQIIIISLLRKLVLFDQLKLLQVQKYTKKMKYANKL